MYVLLYTRVPTGMICVQAVDRPELHHLVNCLVFPQQGTRSHANETSGGDLDGEHILCKIASPNKCMVMVAAQIQN